MQSQVAHHGMAQKFGKDALRLYLTKEISYGSDGDFTWERFEERYNVDLANNLGNLVSRVVSMADRYRAGRIVPAGDGGRLAGVAGSALERYRKAMDTLALHEGVAAAFQIVDAANVFIADNSPIQASSKPSRSRCSIELEIPVHRERRVLAGRVHRRQEDPESHGVVGSVRSVERVHGHGDPFRRRRSQRAERPTGATVGHTIRARSPGRHPLAINDS